MESKSRDQYREEAILWLNRQREYEKLIDNARTTDEVSALVMARRYAETRIKMLASLDGLESIEELEE